MLYKIICYKTVNLLLYLVSAEDLSKLDDEVAVVDLRYDSETSERVGKTDISEKEAEVSATDGL